MPACHLVCRSCPGPWPSSVYPTGVSAVKFPGHLCLSSCWRHLHLNVTESLTAVTRARESGHESSAHVSQWGRSGNRSDEEKLNDNKSLLFGTEASIVCVHGARGGGVRKEKGSRRLRKVSTAKWSTGTAYHRKSGILVRLGWYSKLAGYTGGGQRLPRQPEPYL